MNIDEEEIRMLLEDALSTYKKSADYGKVNGRMQKEVSEKDKEYAIAKGRLEAISYLKKALKVGYMPGTVLTANNENVQKDMGCIILNYMMAYREANPNIKTKTHVNQLLIPQNIGERKAQFTHYLDIEERLTQIEVEEFEKERNLELWGRI